MYLFLILKIHEFISHTKDLCIHISCKRLMYSYLIQNNNVFIILYSYLIHKISTRYGSTQLRPGETQSFCKFFFVLNYYLELSLQKKHKKPQFRKQYLPSFFLLKYCS